MINKSSKGFWEVLTALENSLASDLAKDLSPFSIIVANCYECGVELPTLPHFNEQTTDIQISALFLKRCLNDLRAIWILLSKGYTSQAGAVAAAAFENALVINCIIGKPNKAQKLNNSKSGEVPWTVADMCKMHIKNDKDTESIKYSNVDLEYESNALYSHYVWLCIIKHPNMQSVIHDAFSTKINDNQFGIMAAPDTRQEDLPNKAQILAIILNRIACAIDSFAKVYNLDYTNERVISWINRLDSILPEISNAIDPLINKYPNAPINITKSRFLKRFTNQNK